MKRTSSRLNASTSSPPEQLLEEEEEASESDSEDSKPSAPPPAKKFNKGRGSSGQDSCRNDGVSMDQGWPKEEDDEISNQQLDDFEYDEEEDENDSVLEKLEIPPVDEEFLKKCRSLNLTKEVIDGSWDFYYTATQRVLLAGKQSSWQAVAIYNFFLSRCVKKRGKLGKMLLLPMPVTIDELTNTFNLSVIEFFDKTHRLIETINSRRMRRYSEYVRRMEESLAITAVVYRKYLKIFRTMFTHVPRNTVTRDNEPISPSYDVFKAIWTTFLVMKKSLETDDLVNSINLLLCILDTVYGEMCMERNENEHIKSTFVDAMVEEDMTVLRLLCHLFGGIIIDAKHFREHVFSRMNQDLIPTAYELLNCSELLPHLEATYRQWTLLKGQVDERIFFPKEEEMETVLRADYDDDQSINVLRNDADNRNYLDAELLNRISNQNCLDTLALSTQKDGGFKINPREFTRIPNLPTTNDLFQHPEDKDPAETKRRLERIVGSWEFEKSNLKKYCSELSDDPSVTLLLKKEVLSQRFVEKVQNAPVTEDVEIVDNLEEHRVLLENLFLQYIEKIMRTEIEKKCREEDLLVVLRREEFLDSVFCFCCELLLFCNRSVKAFPWSVEMCELDPFVFHKVIDLMINHEKNLSRPMVQHFNKIEEKIIEELAWTYNSSLWPLIAQCPLKSFNEFGEDWFEKGSSPLKFTPLKKRLMTDDMGRPIHPTNGQSRAVRMFLKRTYFTAALRLHDLADRIGMGVRSKSQIWSLFDYVLRSETVVLMDRHLDQILLCCVYVVAKINQMGTTFTEILGHYKRQTQSSSRIYRSVVIDVNENGEAVVPTISSQNELIQKLNAEHAPVTAIFDIIKFYNVVFRERIKGIIHEIENGTDNELMEMPVPTSYGLAPVRIYITKNFAISALPKTRHGSTKQELIIANISKNGLTYDVTNSPRKELYFINRKIANAV